MFVPSASTAVQVAVVGCVDVAIVPPPPTATQREAEGQDTLVKLFAPILNWLHADAPPLGLVDVATAPATPTATQSDTDGQDTPATWMPEIPVF